MSNIHIDLEWPVSRFRTERRDLTNFIDNNVLPLLRMGVATVVIRAPVKSGKRQMVEYMAQMDSTHHHRAQTRVHCFISAWHRTADDEQRAEISTYNVKVFSVRSRAVVVDIIEWIATQTNVGKTVVIHLDECDHGSGDRQILGFLWRKVKDLVSAGKSITSILYSATPEEVRFSNEVGDEMHDQMMQEFIENGNYLEFTPPPEIFCGPARFLEAELVHEATPFFEKVGNVYNLTSQGKTIMTNFKDNIRRNPRRNLLFVRLSYSNGGNKKENKAIYQFLKNISRFSEFNGVSVLVDKTETGIVTSDSVFPERILWSSATWWNMKAADIPIVVIADQTSSRSTEWAMHDRLFATHDYRNDVTFSIVSQAQERTNHYSTRYGGFQPIRIYGSKKTFELSAGRIDYSAYLHNEYEMKKVDRRRAEGGRDEYTIRRSDNHVIHPSYPHPILFDQAVRVLQNLGCYATASLSARVKGSIRQVVVPKHRFEPGRYHPRAFDTSRAQGLDDNGRYKSYIRGVWAVRTYEDIVSEGWGINRTFRIRYFPCYKDGVEGTCVSEFDREEERDNLTAYRSMYLPRRQT